MYSYNNFQVMSEIAISCMNNMGIFPKCLGTQSQDQDDENSREVGRSVEVSFHEERALVTVNN